VTCDDFAQAIADANPAPALADRLAAFKRWYAQAGTPRLTAHGQYDAQARRYTLTLSQACPATPGQGEKLPFVIPVAMGLISADGVALPLQLAGEDAPHATERVLVLEQASQDFVFEGIAEAPVPSLLRGFSAPVVLQWAASEAELLTLLRHDHDPFNRWEAGQRLALARLLAGIQGEDLPQLGEAYVEAMRAVLRDPHLDAAFKELVLTLPGEGYVAEQLEVVDPQRVHAVREALRAQLAHALREEWALAYEENADTGGYSPDAVSAGRRALANLALQQLVLEAMSSGDPVWPGRAYQRCKDAANMTDRLGALAALVHAGAGLAEPALARFHTQFADEPLVIDKWFALQAAAPEQGGRVLARIKALALHPDFNLRNPNRARSLLATLIHLNPAALHRSDAAGYVFWSEKVVEIDAFNPQLAARIARGLDRWRALAEPYRSAAREALARIDARADLSPDVREIVSRALAD
jgi:aminopeptidase N